MIDVRSADVSFEFCSVGMVSVPGRRRSNREKMGQKNRARVFFKLKLG